MKQYINTSNYYLSTITATINNTDSTGTIEVADIAIDWVTLPTKGYFWIDVDFWDASKREIFRITSRNWYTLTYDKRISPNGKATHAVWATVWLRDFSELLNSLSSNTDNFWQIEHLSWLVIKVFWWNVYASNDYWYKYIPDTTLILPASSNIYIMYNKVDNTFDMAEAIDNSKFLLWRIVTGISSVLNIEDLRSVMVYWGWEWDMKVSIYDPNHINADVFNMDNMSQWQNNLFISPEDAQRWNSKQDHLEPWNTIKTINWESVLWSWDITIEPSLWADFQYEVTDYWVSSYTLTNRPWSSSSFMVYVDSWTGMFPTTDYTYDSQSNTITFVTQLSEWERAIIWMMVSTGVSPEERFINNAYARFIS
jgi:hypothetical protein